jgi:hypothetical protein
VTRLKTDDLAALREGIIQAVHKILGEDVVVEVGRLEGSPDADEILVQIVLADPGEGKTWDQGVTDAIRTAVRETTAEILPSVVATTRLVSSGEDG